MTNQRRGRDSATDAAELEAIDKRKQELREAQAKIVDEQRELTHKRRRVYDRIRERARRSGGGEVAA